MISARAPESRTLMPAAQQIESTSLHIPQDGIQFHPHSFADSDGRLFTWAGTLYRGIREESSQFFGQLFESGIIRYLIDRDLLIDSEVTPLSSGEYRMIIRHKQLPFVSYPNEWCAPMLKDAALSILDLLIELRSYGLTLKDGHPWNVLFDAYRPIYVDLTSIVLATGSGWPPLDEFSRFCTYPLFMMAEGQERIARCLLSEYRGVERSEAMALAWKWGVPSRFVLNRLRRRAAKFGGRLLPGKNGGSDEGLESIKDLRRDLETIDISSGSPHGDLKFSPRRTAPLAGCRVFTEIHSRIHPLSVLTVGGDAASEARAAAETAARVVSLETDPVRADRLYNDARENFLPVLSLVIDFVRPTPSIGFSNHYSIAAHERLSCDLVWAPMLVDELVLKKYLRFELIAEGLSLFSKRWLVIGFSEFDQKNRVSCPPWYTFDNFAEALKKYFRIIEIIEPDSQRVLILCEKK